MFEFVDSIHKALRTESTWAFVFVIASLSFCVGGTVAWIVDQGYKNSAEYKAEHTLSAEWHREFLPALVPPEETVYVLELWPLPVENGGGGLAEVSGIPGNPMGWPTSNGQPLSSWRCQLTNYSSSPLFNVSLVLQLAFQKAVKGDQQPGTARSGETTLSRGWPINVQKIDAGADHPFIFYIFNNSDHFASVAFPPSATGRRAGDKEQRTIELIQPESSMMPLPPFIRTNQ